MSLADQILWGLDNFVGGGVENIPQSIGTLYYVSNTNGNDGNTGLSPDNAKATIGNAITTCSAGDIIIIEAGTYPEDVVLNKDSVELWFEIGAIITAQAGVGLNVSGDYCKIITPDGVLRINPVANGTGVVVSGIWSYLWNIRIPCASSADVGFDLTGDNIVINNCIANDPLITAFKIQGDAVHLHDCWTSGLAADTSAGYWITNNADKTRLRECASQGHISGGYVVDSGVTNGEAIRCVSGGGDGLKADPTHAFVWADYSFDDVVHKTVTYSAGTTHNIFKIIGTVHISKLYGTVETTMESVASLMHLEVFSAGGSVVITKIAGAPDISGLVEKSLLIKGDDAGSILNMASAATPSIVERVGAEPDAEVIIVADDNQDTFIRSNITAALASGVIDWHCEYEPLSNDGFVETA